MTLLIGLMSFAVGLIVGAVLFRQFKSDAAKVKLLEEQLEALETEHEKYKDNVHNHFSATAQLLNNLTDSYREVYRHMASGAQSLCPEYISDQLTHSARSQEAITMDTFAGAGGNAEAEEILPPRDYAAKTSPDQKGNLAEDYGLDKVSANE